MPELSLVDNVRLPLLLAKAGRPETARRAAEVLERLEITVSGRRPGEVFGGQQQRAATPGAQMLARAEQVAV